MKKHKKDTVTINGEEYELLPFISDELAVPEILPFIDGETTSPEMLPFAQPTRKQVQIVNKLASLSQ